MLTDPGCCSGCQGHSNPKANSPKVPELFRSREQVVRGAYRAEPAVHCAWTGPEPTGLSETPDTLATRRVSPFLGLVPIRHIRRQSVGPDSLGLNPGSTTCLQCAWDREYNLCKLSRHPLFRRI